MKTKTLNKRLVFKKETVANLDNVHLGQVKGNGVITRPQETIVIDCTEVSCLATCAATCAATCVTCSCYTDGIQVCPCTLPPQ